MKDLKIPGDPELVPSVILTEAEHKAITARLARETRGAKDLQELWSGYERAYKDYPEWLKAIESYFIKGK